MSADFDAAFAALREALLRAAPCMMVARDLPGDLMLQTPEIDPKTGAHAFFASVTTKKAYVAFHLMPLYYQPDLLEGLTPELERRRQGKTCFNFKRPAPLLFAELEALAGRVTA